jgi:hypothetical protein
MTDEQIWLLIHGRQEVPWYKVITGLTGEQITDPLFARLRDAGKLKADINRMTVRLKEENESIRI